MTSQVTKSRLTVTTCVSFCILIIAYITINFQVNKSSNTAILPENVFAFGPVPQVGQVGGLHGVFIQQATWLADFADEIDCKHYEAFRFYSDGIVLHQGLCLEGNFMESWSDIKKWFHRSNYLNLARGEYYISDNRIWFSTTSQYSFTNTHITVDYSGTFSESKLILDSYGHSNGYTEKKAKFYKIEVEE